MRKLRWEVVDPGFPGTSGKSGTDLHSFRLLRLCKHVEWWQPTSVSLPGEFHGQRSQTGYSPWDHKESDTTVRLSLSGCCSPNKDLSQAAVFLFFLRYNIKMLLSINLGSQSSRGSKSWKWLTEQSYGSRVACWGFPTRSPDSKICGWARYKAHPVLTLNLLLSLYWVPILVRSIAKSPSSNPEPFFTLASFLPTHMPSHHSLSLSFLNFYSSLLCTNNVSDFEILPCRHPSCVHSITIPDYLLCRAFF